MKHGSDKFGIAGQPKKDLLRLLHAYRQAIDESVISSITDTKGTIIYANKKFCEVTKYSADELVGQNHRIINSGYHPKEFFKNMWKTIGNGGIWHNEVKNKAKDGTYYWVDTVVLPIKDDNGKIIQYLSLRTLISEKIQLQKEKEEYIKSLEEMLFMTSHKVRKPICTFLGLMQLIDSDKLLSEQEQKKILGHAKSTALELDTFTKELTTFIYEVKKTDKKKNNR